MLDLKRREDLIFETLPARLFLFNFLILDCSSNWFLASLHAEFYNVDDHCKEALVVGAIVLAISLELVVMGDNDSNKHIQQSDPED